MRILKRYRFPLLILTLDLVLLLAKPEIGRAVFSATSKNLIQMVQILPAIFVLLGLLDTWVPRQTVIAALGTNSGVLGVLLAMLLGAAAAGPLYAAFPVASAMLLKGASMFNVFVFIGTWANLKIPMALFELASMGPQFAFTRWAANIFGTIGIAFIMKKILGDTEIERILERQKVLQAEQAAGISRQKPAPSKEPV